jgi:20S proteasome alpha/beta subunit
MAKPVTKDETKVYYLKMMGDYMRYSAEVSTGSQAEKTKKECTKLYEDANMVALGPCSSVRLGLILNLSVFYHDTCKEHKKACNLADKALSEAMEKVDDLGENDFQDAKNLIE